MIASSPSKQNSRHSAARSAALTMSFVGAIGSFALLLRAGRQTPPLVMVMMQIWVLTPFAILAWANFVSTRWSANTRATLYFLTFALTPLTLYYYWNPALRPAGSSYAFLFVMIPPVSVLLLAAVVPLVAFISRRNRAGGDLR